MAALSRFISKSTDKCIPFFNLLKGGKKFEWTKECGTAFQALKAHLSQPPILAKLEVGEALVLYLATTEHAISSVLLREERAQMKLVYYMSKQLPYYGDIGSVLSTCVSQLVTIFSGTSN